MEISREIEKRDLCIMREKKKNAELLEEIESYRQLLDCAAANILLLVNEKEKKCKISRSEVSSVLGKYHLQATTDNEGNYVLEVVEN